MQVTLVTFERTDNLRSHLKIDDPNGVVKIVAGAASASRYENPSAVVSVVNNQIVDVGGQERVTRGTLTGGIDAPRYFDALP